MCVCSIHSLFPPFWNKERLNSSTVYVWGFFWPADRNGQQSLTDDNFNCRSHPSLWPQTPRSTLRNKRERGKKKNCGVSLKQIDDRETTLFPIMAADSRCTNSQKDPPTPMYIVLCRWSTTTKIYIGYTNL